MENNCIRIDAEVERLFSENDETTVLPKMITPNIIETEKDEWMDIDEQLLEELEWPSSNDPKMRLRLAREKYEGEIKSFTKVDELEKWIRSATSDQKMKVPKFCFKGFVVSIEPNLKFKKNNTIVTRIK
jgi:hypothetical protein